MTSKADNAIQNLSELEEILSSQKNGDPAILKEVSLKLKQFRESLIKELKIASQSKPVVEQKKSYKNLSASVDEIIEKLYKK